MKSKRDGGRKRKAKKWREKRDEKE